MDWIECFMEYTSSLPTPQIFRLWAGITAISGALDRRIWADLGPAPVFPNLYTMLVGVPGTGKSQACAPVRTLWTMCRELHVAPDNVTKAALIDSLHKNSRFFLNDSVPGGMLEIHSVLVAAPELGVLMSKHDLEFISVLNHIFDSPPIYSEERRSMEGRQPEITNPQLTILSGAQPDFLGSILPEEAWGMGFCSRLLLIYAAVPPKIKLFSKTSKPDPQLLKQLSYEMDGMANLYGEMSWTEEAQAAVAVWYDEGLIPVPTHSKLLHYSTRRLLLLTKLITIASISRKRDKIILAEDVERAKNWMLDAEKVMPDVFRAMLAKNDSELLQELHRYIWRLWASALPEQRKPVAITEVYTFLKDRAPSERIDRLVDIAEKSGLLVRSPVGGWIPKPLINLPGNT